MMRRTRMVLTMAAPAVALLLSLGCADRDAGGGTQAALSEQEKKAEKEKKIEAARARLSPEDRSLVDAQDFCAVMPKQKLGSMGAPLKVMIKGQLVFLCCKGCKGTAEHEPDETLKTAEELKARNRKK